jgi:hypothetical protein
MLSAPGGAHFIAGPVEIVRVNEVCRTVPDHILRRVSENRKAARTHLDKCPLPVDHQDEVERRIEYPLPLRDFAVESRRFFPHIGRHAAECTSQDTDFSAASGRQDQRPVTRKAFNRTGHLDQGSGERTRQEDCNESREEDGAGSSDHDGLPQGRGGTHDHRI